MHIHVAMPPHHNSALCIIMCGQDVTNTVLVVQDALVALAPCTPSILIVDAPCSRFAGLGQQLPSLRHVVALGGSDVAKFTCCTANGAPFG